VLYLLYVLVSFGGLALAASVAPVAHSLGVDGSLSVAALSLPLVTVAPPVSRIAEGIGRLILGWVSDRIGREYTMALSSSRWRPRSPWPMAGG
jgi:OFA family oxalate/formate antiporter-like MFS transporter